MYISNQNRINYNKKHLLKKITKRKQKKNNKKYIQNALQNNKKLFDNINGTSLDNNQREIIVSEENSALLIAGAGSGKTLTIIGRLIYLIKKGVNPKDILVISFTKEASINLKNKLLKNKINIDVMTFHKLGRNILKKNNFPVSLVSQKALDIIINKHLKNYKPLTKLLPDMKFITIGYEDMSDLQHAILLESKEAQSLKKLIHTFINLFKSNNYNLAKFNEFLKQNEKEKDYYYQKHKLFLNLAKDIYEDYEYYLIKNNQIDFHDMINKSIDLVLKNGIYEYKYIIIDEYQDTSLVKCKLIQTIKNKTNASLLAVGDDFQSIYRFTGTNLKVFLDFEKYFLHSQIYKLEKTYRNSQELLNITSKFILKNKKQIYKNLYSDKTNANPIYICYYETDFKEALNKVIKKINKTNFLVLARNNKTLENITYNKMTVHKSKGLEADNIIIIGLEDTPLGFPNKIVSDKVLKYVLNEKDSILYEEERRLFYVALTRTKNANYLLVNKKNPSVFVEEIIKDNKNIKIIQDEYW